MTTCEPGPRLVLTHGFGFRPFVRGLIEAHFWLATIGVVLYITSMWVAGIMQGLMWRAVNAEDGTLTYSFVESLVAMYPFYYVRLLGGIIFLSGMFVMAWNVWKTVKGATPVNAPVAQAA